MVERDTTDQGHVDPPSDVEELEPTIEDDRIDAWKARFAQDKEKFANQETLQSSPPLVNCKDRAIVFLTTLNRVIILALLNIGAFGVLLYSYTDRHTIHARPPGQQTIQAATNKEGLDAVAALYDSTDPSARQQLLDVLSVTTDPMTRKEILKVLIFRFRRQGFARTSDIILTQLLDASKITSFGLDDLSRPLVRLLDPGLSSDARLEELARLYEVAPRLGSILAASSALDTAEAETYRGLLAKAVADQAGIPNGGEHNSYALMALLPDAYDLFSQDILKLQDKIPASDIVWLLDELGRQGRSEVSTIAQVAESRNILTGAHVVFSRELRRSFAFKQPLRRSLVSGALGKISMHDIRRFGEWDGPGAPSVLEASVITTTDESLRSAAFDALSGKPSEDPYVNRLIEFVRTTYGDESARFAGVVAAVALRDVVSSETLNREFDALQNAPRAAQFLNQLTRQAPPEVVLIVLERFSESIDPLNIVDLLTHTSPQVRAAAVSSLTKVNDILLLKLISQSYDDETDPKVRAVYEEKISVVRERTRGW
jgi:hypothetical protein